ncbi:hypothetical protein [Aquimarina algicola]|uniref:Uncharacterized protein n=1 Tax=Aquimarina algicola TaxID=2589995 RepID=A0A504JI33_9FLAO|nr:hypothetical protein [Aquimarina algicola]TPN86140.1 hypothetical protein FHK87_12770 [Aquimarina algicola]
MKEIKKLQNVRALSKQDQRTINGGASKSTCGVFFCTSQTEGCSCIDSNGNIGTCFQGNCS